MRACTNVYRECARVCVCVCVVSVFACVCYKEERAAALTVLELEVDPAAVPVIVGRGGGEVQRVEKATGARVQVLGNRPTAANGGEGGKGGKVEGSGESARVVLRGSPSEVEAAAELVRAAIAKWGGGAAGDSGGTPPLNGEAAAAAGRSLERAEATSQGGGVVGHVLGSGSACGWSREHKAGRLAAPTAGGPARPPTLANGTGGSKLEATAERAASVKEEDEEGEDEDEDEDEEEWKDAEGEVRRRRRS